MTEPVTVPSIAQKKRARGDEPIVMVTAYDEPFARFADAAGVDLILVGDSVADNVLGYENTLQVDVAQIAHHVGAVARAKPRALVVADLPWMSYHLDPLEAVRNAATLVRAGAKAVKLEGGRRRLLVIHAILDAEIPVMGHLGLTPQSLLVFGGFRVQGRVPEAALSLELDAKALDSAGCFAIVLEGIPDLLAEKITESVEIPTIGIGAGSGTDGQVLVVHDLLGMSRRPAAKFVRRYADIAQVATDAIG
ncbi:MAG: 3-methyl-2-oxobutanoate hydroxymethyltransferase, partial [Acidimicrobiales bacterium]